MAGWRFCFETPAYSVRLIDCSFLNSLTKTMQYNYPKRRYKIIFNLRRIPGKKKILMFKMKIKVFKIQLFFFIRINERFLLARSFLVKFFFGEQDPRFWLVVAWLHTKLTNLGHEDTEGSQTASLVMFIAFNFTRLFDCSVFRSSYSAILLVFSWWLTSDECFRTWRW